MDKKSLVDLANEAGFANIHSLPGRTTGLIGSVMSDDYEIIYFTLNNDYKLGEKNPSTGSFPVLDIGTVEILGIVDPYKYETCALYRVERKDLVEWVGKGGVNIDRLSPIYKGGLVVDILIGFAKRIKEQGVKKDIPLYQQ